MVNADLAEVATETFSFRMSKALRDRLGAAARKRGRTVGREIVLRLIASFDGDLADDDQDEEGGEVPASPKAKAAWAKAEANEAKIAALEARVAALEQNSGARR